MTDFSKSYGVRRPLEIAAKIAAVQARLAPVAIEAAPAVASLEIEAPEAQARPLFVEANPLRKEEFMRAQKRMFAAANAAKLSHKGTLRMAGINALIGLDLDSSRRLTPCELHHVADAIQSGLFSSEWELVSVPLGDQDAPPEIEAAPDFGTPATLEAVEALGAGFDAACQIEAEQHAERDQLSIERDALNREIESAQARLRELDALLCFDYSRPFILGFDDLPQAYFTLLEAGRLAA